MHTRRNILVAMAGTAAFAVGPARAANNSVEIDSQVDEALAEMYEQFPGTRELSNRSKAMLVMPGVVKGGFVVGGAYGEGALRMPADGYARTKDYYSFASASIGFQAGLQRTRHTLFFMTDSALSDFERKQGFEVGVDAEVTVLDAGFNAALNTTSTQRPVLALVFGKTGLLAGASLEGGKYSLIAR